MRRLLNNSYWTCCVALLLIGCATQKKTTTSTSAPDKYSEDLAVWRPKADPVTDTNTTAELPGKKQPPYVEPKYAVNKKLDTVLDSIDHFNLQRNFVDGFTIQVYSGTKREDALNAKKDLSSYIPELESDVQYSQPNFRVKVGKYFNRIEAQKDYLIVKKYFPTAIIIPDKVSIN
jgi:hypothetical protein